MDIGEIAQHLNVQTVLEGTVRKSGARLRVTAQLISSCEGSQIWSERYDRSEGDVFDIQEEIANAIVKNLKGRLMSGQLPTVRRVTDNVDAYKLYLKGRYAWERRNRAALQNAITYFEQAISADPDYALAHAVWPTALIMGVYRAHPEYTKGSPTALRALELEPELAEAHHLGAVKQFLEWNWSKPTHVTRAPLSWIPGSLSPGMASNSLRCKLMRPAFRAMKLEPDSGLIAYIAAINHYWAGIQTVRRNSSNARLNSNRRLFLPTGFAHSSSSQGVPRGSNFGHDARGGVANHHPLLVSALGAAYARAGKRAEAEKLINELNEDLHGNT